MSIERRWYIYRHLRVDNGNPFYIGKGCFRKNRRTSFERAFATNNRNPFWKHTVSNAGGFDVEIMMHDLTEKEANNKEVEFIKLYGRSNKSGGTLCNLTDGGDGWKGVILSEEECRRRSERVRGEKHPNWGKHRSPETLLKMSLAKRGNRNVVFGRTLPKQWRENIAKGKLGPKNPMYGKISPCALKVRNTITGTIYPSIAVAAKCEKVNPSMLYQYLEGTKRNKTPLELVG